MALLAERFTTFSHPPGNSFLCRTLLTLEAMITFKDRHKKAIDNSLAGVADAAKLTTSMTMLLSLAVFIACCASTT